MANGAKRLPYGISNFFDLRRNNQYYADKTMYIPTLEDAGNFLFLIRPRRFGKSIFLSMLAEYYDIARQDRFDTLFDGLWIQQHPTPEKGAYQVIHMDFSQATAGLRGTLKERFDKYCCMIFESFADKYAASYDEEFVPAVKQRRPDSTDQLRFICQEAHKRGNQLYLIIDEYDNFTNNVLNEEGEQVYHALTHATGFYREVFKVYKANFQRILMMGVSPVTLDDLTSGFNIALNITSDPRFNMMLGFSETEVREMIAYYQEVGLIKTDADTLVEEMKPWYDNYCFAEESFGVDPKMFNSDMVIYYLRHQIAFGTSPKNMLDTNTRTDYKKLKRLVELEGMGTDQRSIIPNRSLDIEHVANLSGADFDPQEQAVASHSERMRDKIRPEKTQQADERQPNKTTLRSNDRFGIIQQITAEGHIVGNLQLSFPAEHIFDEGNFISLLYYYGMLTIAGTKGDRLTLGIPNNNVRKQYYEYLLNECRSMMRIDFSPLGDVFYDMAYDGRWRPAFEMIASQYAQVASVRNAIQGERNLQGFVMSTLSLCSYYLMMPEVEMAHGYCDIFLMPDHQRYPETAHSYILELKYLTAKDSQERAEQQWEEAVEQVKRYAEDRKVKLMSEGTELHLLVMQMRNTELLRLEEVQASPLG